MVEILVKEEWLPNRASYLSLESFIDKCFFSLHPKIQEEPCQSTSKTSQEKPSKYKEVHLPAVQEVEESTTEERTSSKDLGLPQNKSQKEFQKDGIKDGSNGNASKKDNTNEPEEGLEGEDVKTELAELSISKKTTSLKLVRALAGLLKW